MLQNLLIIKRNEFITFLKHHCFRSHEFPFQMIPNDFHILYNPKTQVIKRRQIMWPENSAVVLIKIIFLCKFIFFQNWSLRIGSSQVNLAKKFISPDLPVRPVWWSIGSCAIFGKEVQFSCSRVLHYKWKPWW